MTLQVLIYGLIQGRFR